MTTALIGYTGFVGGNLLRQTAFDDLFNSKNIETIQGRSYDRLVCAGAPAEKWKANQNPAADEAVLARLMQCLSHVQAKQVVLISTVDVYPQPIAVDESTEAAWQTGTAYGRHRYALEQFVAQRFPSLIVRLPGLFGQGLKKNIVYDFLHGNQVDKIHCEARFQFYGLDRLWTDIQTALRHRLTLVNAATEPVSVGDVARRAFGQTFDQRPAGVQPALYDMHSRYSDFFGGQGPYWQSAAEVLESMRAYVASTRQAKAAAPGAGA